MSDLFDPGPRVSRYDPWIAVLPKAPTGPMPMLRLATPPAPPALVLPEPVEVAPEPEPEPAAPVLNLEHSGWTLPFAPPPITPPEFLR